MDKLNMLSATQVAGVLGIHVNTVKRTPPAILPYFRVGSRGDRRYAVADVEKYLERCRVDR